MPGEKTNAFTFCSERRDEERRSCIQESKQQEKRKGWWRDLGKLRLGLLKCEVTLRKHWHGPFSNMESMPRKEVGHW